MDETELRPFRPLGQRLKALRTQAKETLAEASGAVEIDVKELASFELGQSRPSEDVLLLLISHFGAKDDEAVRMWEMAGYGAGRISTAHLSSSDSNDAQTTDQPILFTDTVDIVVNNYGVVMHFMQSAGASAKPNVVSRIGMSREHAKSVLQILQLTLQQTEKNSASIPKKIIAPDNSSPDEHHSN